MKTKTTIIILLTLTACTDASWGKFRALGDAAHVECYSGGKLIYKGRSTGKVQSEQSSDGYYFIDEKDGKPKEVSGDCIVTYSDEPGSASVEAK